MADNFTVDMRLKDFFFDRMKVQTALDRAERRELSRIGAFIRRRASSSLRRRKKPSAPGATPSVHSKDKTANLKNILFAYSPGTHSVIVGPVGLNQQNSQPGGTNIPIPALMEFGGTVAIEEVQHKDTDQPDQWFRRNRNYSKRPWKRYRTRTAQYPARPFMGPALAAEISAGTIRDQWIGSLEAA